MSTNCHDDSNKRVNPEWTEASTYDAECMICGEQYCCNRVQWVLKNWWDRLIAPDTITGACDEHVPRRHSTVKSAGRQGVGV